MSDLCDSYMIVVVDGKYEWIKDTVLYRHQCGETGPHLIHVSESSDGTLTWEDDTEGAAPTKPEPRYYVEEHRHWVHVRDRHNMGAAAAMFQVSSHPSPLTAAEAEADRLNGGRA